MSLPTAEPTPTATADADMVDQEAAALLEADRAVLLLHINRTTVERIARRTYRTYAYRSGQRSE